MSTNRPEKLAQELAIFQCRGEQGLQSLRQWLYERKEGSRWVGLTGDDLIREQGEIGMVSRLIKLIDVGPSNKGEA